MVRESYAYLKGALEKDDKNFAIHKWYAILLDAKSNLDGLKERVTQLENVKKHMLVIVLKIVPQTYLLIISILAGS